MLTRIKFLIGWMLWLLPVCCLGKAASAEPALIIEGVECRGNASTPCGFILSHLYESAGDPLDENEVRNARLRLSSLPNFDSVDIYLEKGSEKGKARVVVEVMETDPLAAELIAGTSLRDSAMSQVVVGRLTRRNLFGSDKLLDSSVIVRTPLEGQPTLRSLSSGVTLIDPHLFGAKRNFFYTGLFYDERHFKNAAGERFDSRMGGAAVVVGRRLWDFSYVTLGYQYDALSKYHNRSLQSDGSFLTTRNSYPHSVFASYGWNSEDDAYFPTQGSRLTLRDTLWWGDAHLSNFNYAFRKTWKTQGGSIWTVKIGGTPGTEYLGTFDEHQARAITYARDFTPTGIFSGARRVRWYIEPGLDNYTGPDEAWGLKTGLRFDIQNFGIVDLYLIGVWRAGAGHRL